MDKPDKPKRKRPRKGYQTLQDSHLNLSSRTAAPTQTIVLEEVDEGLETSKAPHYQTFVSPLPLPLQQTNPQYPSDPSYHNFGLPSGQLLPSNSRRYGFCSQTRSSSRLKNSDDEIVLPRPLLQISYELNYLLAAQKELQRRTELTAHEITKNKDCMMAEVAQSILLYLQQLMV